jgi:hypothetical protein
MTAPDYQRLTDRQTSENLYHSALWLNTIEIELRDVITRSDTISGVRMELLRSHQERLVSTIEFLTELAHQVDRESLMNSEA